MNEPDSELTSEERRLLASLRETAPPPATLEARSLETLRERRLLRAAPRPWQRQVSVLWLIAASVACIALGRTLPFPRADGPIPTGETFMLLLHQSETAALEEDASLEVAREYGEWARSLGSAFVDGSELDENALRMRPSAGGVERIRTGSEGEHVGGYFVVRAPDLAAAALLAEGCPHLEHGWIEVRRLVP